MTTTLNIPLSPPTAGGSPCSDDSYLPCTPISPDMHIMGLSASADAISNSVAAQPASNSSNSPLKRKPSRRANTAERRATHNAVERQRRETLNGRFLDLAALLPNLSQIRRPSKSSIVNNSIAHIHASRRHRLMASRELRLLKLESDALRRELNEWRDRAGLPRLEEPVRGDGFTMVLSGEIEVLTSITDDDEENGHGHDGFDDHEDDFVGAPQLGFEEGDDPRSSHSNISMLNVNAPTPFTTHNMPAQGIQRPQNGPMIASNAPSVSFENPAMASMYETQVQGLDGGSLFMQPQDIKGAWDAFLGTTQGHQQPIVQGRGYISPIVTGPPSGNGPASFADHTGAPYFQRQQHMSPLHGMGHIYGSPEADDTSSIGSAREASPPGSYDLAPTVEDLSEFGIPRLSARNMQMSPAAGAWCRRSEGSIADAMMMKQHMTSPIGVGGGNGGFLMMMS
jgi:hypothetical protein